MKEKMPCLSESGLLHSVQWFPVPIKCHTFMSSLQLPKIPLCVNACMRQILLPLNNLLIISCSAMFILQKTHIHTCILKSFQIFKVLCLTLRFLLHFELIFMWCERQVSSCSCTCGKTVLPTPFVRDWFFPQCAFLTVCQKLGNL